jgi:hypothetical protein
MVTCISGYYLDSYMNIFIYATNIGIFWILGKSRNNWLVPNFQPSFGLSFDKYNTVMSSSF